MIRANDSEPIARRCAKAALLFGLLAVLFAGPGCHRFRKEEPIVLNIRSRTYPADTYTAVKRVLILPFYNETAFAGQPDVVGAAFTRECTERGCFEAVLPQAGEEQGFEDLDPSRTGRISTRVLIELGASYKVDAILLGSLKMYNPYHPQMIGLKADLISVNNGSILRTVTGLLDAQDIMVGRDIARYYEDHCSDVGSAFTGHLVLNSPELFARYACGRFVEALYPEM